MKQIEIGEWLYHGNFIQLSIHPLLYGKYEIFKNNKEQTHIDRCCTLKEAKEICRKNKSKDNYLKF